MHNYVDPDTIKVNPDAVINNKKIGEKNHSLIVVDDFLMNPDQLITDYVEHVPVTLNRVRDDSIMDGLGKLILNSNKLMLHVLNFWICLLILVFPIMRSIGIDGTIN